MCTEAHKTRLRPFIDDRHALFPAGPEFRASQHVVEDASTPAQSCPVFAFFSPRLTRKEQEIAA